MHSVDGNDRNSLVPIERSFVHRFEQTPHDLGACIIDRMMYGPLCRRRRRDSQKLAPDTNTTQPIDRVPILRFFTQPNIFMRARAFHS